MNRIFVYAGLLAWVTLAGGCGDSSPSGPGDSGGGSRTAAGDSLFADRGLEVAVRAALSRPEGKVTQEELSSLKNLDARDRGIKELTGIGRLDSLQSLNLSDNEVTDLSPLASLVRLEYLDLSNNHLTEISALASLVQLKVLILERNALQDLSPLQGLSHLERLELTEGMVESTATAALQESGVKVVWAMAGELPSSGEADIGPRVGAGPRIAYSVLKTGMDSDIWVMAPDGSNQTALINSTDNETQPAWSPDGTQLAYARGAEGFRHIYVLRSGSGSPTRLTRDRGDECTPSWSPDGSRIAYMRGYDIYVSAADGSGSRNLTQHPAKDFDPSWSPDGMRIVFASNRDCAITGKQSDIFVMDADGANPVNLTHRPSWIASPCFSPDGSQIAYYSDRERDIYRTAECDIYLMAADGNDLRNLTSTWANGATTWPRRLSWLPDGRLLLEYNSSICTMAPADSRPTAIASGFGIADPAWVADAAIDLTGIEAAPPRFFADANLERAVLAQLLYISRDKITETDLSAVTKVSCPNCGIRDLTGMEKLSSLQQLLLNNGLKYPGAMPDETWNQVSDLSALAGLTQLKELRLALGPEADLSPLAGLEELIT